MSAEADAPSRLPRLQPPRAFVPLRGNGASSSRDSEVIFAPRAGKVRRRGDNATSPNRDVCRDAHKIADPRFLPDDRVAHGAAINRRIGADLDAVLNNDPANPRRPGKSVRGEGNAGMAEIDTWLTDAHPRMQDNPVADQRMGNRCLWPDQAIAADADIRTDDAVRAND